MFIHSDIRGLLIYDSEEWDVECVEGNCISHVQRIIPFPNGISEAM